MKTAFILVGHYKNWSDQYTYFWGVYPDREAVETARRIWQRSSHKTLYTMIYEVVDPHLVTEERKTKQNG